MNRTPRLPVPQHDHYAELHYCDIHGGDRETIGPFRTSAERDRVIRARIGFYPGSYQPSVRRFSRERGA